jgi:hypothetical protein
VINAGDRIGDWIVERKLGAGGMGSVYLCRSTISARIKAAVKIVNAGAGEESRERFVHELETLHGLRHPAIVKVVGWGQAGGGLFIAMDLVEGHTLEERKLRQLHLRDGRAGGHDLPDGPAQRQDHRPEDPRRELGGDRRRVPGVPVNSVEGEVASPLCPNPLFPVNLITNQSDHSLK